jgi:flagellar hook protein FlgE
MSSAFSIALSSLQAQSQAIDTTGNNLANMNTVGFKSSTVDFETLISENLGSGSAFQVGLGVGTPVNQQAFTQGPLQSSNSKLAAAIQGNGFFIVNNSGGQQLFTRDGDFTVDKTGTLTTLTGEKVQGWIANAAGNINTNGAIGNIVLPSGELLPATPTTTFSMNGNLDSATTPGGQGFSQPISIVDSLGNTHTLTVTFTNVSGTTSGGTTYPANTWTYDVTIPQGDLSGTPALTADPSLLSAPGVISFNTDGSLNTSASGFSPTATLKLPGTYTLADSASFGTPTGNTITFNLLDSSGAPTLTQFAQASGIGSKTVDGSQAAQLSDFSIENGGLIVATFSNGQQQIKGQLALAAIQNPDTLQNVGNNNLIASGATAQPAIGVPLSAGRGQIFGAQLEGSNVDMATEFTKLITYQRAYQASSRVITTADQMSQDLMNLIH